MSVVWWMWYTGTRSVVSTISSLLVIQVQVIMGSTQHHGDQKNVFGGPLELCSSSPQTGWYRDGFCRTDQHDQGSHTVCSEMTVTFLEYTKRLGNDLSTPRPQFGFPGLRPGDRWCVCAGRWREAMRAGVAPPVMLEATHQSATRVNSVNEMSNS